MATKSETYDVNRFLRLIKAHKASASTINMLVDSIHAQQNGRKHLGKLRTELCEHRQQLNEYAENYKMAQESITAVSIKLFVLTPAIDVGKRHELAKQMKSLANEAYNWRSHVEVKTNIIKSINKQIDNVIDSHGDCDTSLELAIQEYYNAVKGYNEIAEKLSKFKGINIPAHDTQEITKVKTFEINPHFGEEDNSEVLI